MFSHEPITMASTLPGQGCVTYMKTWDGATCLKPKEHMGNLIA